MMRSGMVAVVGRPNVGKSSLVNALVGRKVSIVAPKPQTTRHRLHGVLHGDGLQIVFIDTPGLHQGGKRALNRYMNDTALAALDEVDLVLFVVEAGRWTEEDQAVLRRLSGAQAPVGLLVNKVDRVSDKNLLLPEIARLAALREFAFVIPASAERGENLDALRGELASRMPEGPPLYPPEQISSQGLDFTIAETVREKLIRALSQELPYALTVETESLERSGVLVKAQVVIWVEREGQKKIVIGEGGEMLKRVGSAARRDLEKTLGGRFHLQIWVRVKENWSDDPRSLRRFGYQDG